MRPASTIASAFDPRRNSLNAIRLLLAVLVIVSHTWPVGGYGQDPGSGPNENLGAWAVAGFFAISGYLITGSRLASLSLRDYLWRRLLRIYPAFLVVLLVVAFGFAPLSLLLDPSAGWSPAAALRFVVRDLGLYMFEYGVGDTLQHVPTPAVWNASLWTLSYEFACYLMIGVLVTVVRRPGVLLRVCAALLVLGTAAMLARQVLGVEDDSQAVRIVRLSTYFLAGAVLFLLKERVPSSAALAAVAAATVAVLAGTGWFEVLAALPVAYLMLWLGARLPLARIGARHDVSYGMYVYAFPVQQTLVLLTGAAVLPAWAFALIATAATAPFAWASWLLVERPAMRLKRLTAKRVPDRERHVPVAAREVARPR